VARKVPTVADARPDRRVRLDAAALMRVRASQVLALDPAALGSIVVLEEAAPEVETQVATSVAVVPIRGPLAQRAYDGSLCGYVDGYDAIAERFIGALDDPRVGAVVLSIDSPGGDVAGLEEAVRRMVQARDDSAKPVYAYADEQTASAAYWIAASVAGRGHVFLPESGEVGSIGCIGARIDETAALEQEGIAVTIVRDPPGKAASHPAGPVAEVADERLTKIVGEVATRFIKAMASSRRMAQRTVRALDGAMLSGQEAVEVGLADGVSSFEAVIERAAADAAKRNIMREQLQALRAQHDLPETATEDEILDATLATLAAGRAADSEWGEKIRPKAEIGEALLALAETDDPVVARGKVEAWKASHERATDERAELAAERKSLDEEKRDKLGARAVNAGQYPAVTWADPKVATDPAKRQLAEPWASMPIKALEAFVETLEAQPRAFAGGETKAAVGAGLSEFERRLCKEKGIDPAEFAERKAAVEARRATQRDAG